MGSHKEKSSKHSKKSKKSSKKKHSSRKDDDRKRRRSRDRSESDSGSSTGTDSGSDSDAGAKRHKSEKLAQKVVAHLQRTAMGPDAPFVWAKKVEKEIGEGKKLKEISIFSDKNRQQERLEELEKVRKRQAEREAEKARREEELSLVQRMRAAQEAMESEAKEEEFYLQALLAKAERRLKEARPAPSDLIARNLHAGLRFGEHPDMDLKEPWTYFEGLQLDDVEALHADIKEYAEYDKYEPLHAEFWRALLEVAEFELAEAQKRDAIDRAHLRGGAAAAAAVAEANEAAEADKRLHDDVEREITAMLQGQTYGELCGLESSMQASLDRGEGDPEYWQAVLSRLKIYKAKAHVRDLQARVMAAALQRLAQDAAEAAEAEGLSLSSEPESDGEGEEPEGDGAGPSAPRGGQAGTLGAGGAVARAMGWAKERRGVTRAAGGEPGEGDEAAGLPGIPEGRSDGEESDGEGRGRRGPEVAAPANPEEIDLDASDGEKEGDNGNSGPAGEDGGEGAPMAAMGAAGAAGPAPAQIVYPHEIPGFGRRYPRKRRNPDGTDPDNDPQRVGGDAQDLPDEVIADGSMSPLPIRQSDLQPGDEVIHEEDDYKQLELLRQQARLQASATFAALARRTEKMGSYTYDRSVRNVMRDNARFGGGGVHPMFRNVAGAPGVEEGGAFRAGITGDLSREDEQALAQFRAVSLKQMGADGADRDFGGEVPLDSQVYWWHDKYKPRKPKYFNRVHTGYEWNKYNQTHYDYDNPPPKVVQGYKFNILYHDLLDKSKAPQYVLEKDPTSPDNSTCIIRFIAGPPYEDIAFRVVNKEWNYARKHGFRCSFERGILHLFFNFKRTRYRR